MYKKILKIIPTILLLALLSCGGSSSPEDVTKQFAQALADGDYEKAMELSDGNMKEYMQAAMDDSLESYETEIINIDCEVSEEIASCLCIETREGMDMTYTYELKHVNGEWKVASYAKDMDYDGALDSADIPNYSAYENVEKNVIRSINRYKVKTDSVELAKNIDFYVDQSDRKRGFKLNMSRTFEMTSLDYRSEFYEKIFEDIKRVDSLINYVEKHSPLN